MPRDLEPSELSVECPSCGAAIGQHCRVVTGMRREAGVAVPYKWASTSAFAHVERRRANGREKRRALIERILIDHLDAGLTPAQLAAVIVDAMKIDNDEAIAIARGAVRKAGKLR